MIRLARPGAEGAGIVIYELVWAEKIARFAIPALSARVDGVDLPPLSWREHDLCSLFHILIAAPGASSIIG